MVVPSKQICKWFFFLWGVGFLLCKSRTRQCWQNAQRQLSAVHALFLFWTWAPALTVAALYSGVVPCTQFPVQYSGVAPPSTLLTVDDADQRPVRCQYTQYDQSRKRNAARKKSLKIKCPFVFLPLYEYVDKRKTWLNETESFHSGKMSTSFTTRVHQVRKWAIELSLLNELLSDLVARARVVSKCQRPSVPRALLGHSLPCISPKAKQIPDLDFKSVFYLRRIHLGNLYRHSTSWYFSGVAYNQWIVH